jgi:hypothetical protein
MALKKDRVELDYDLSFFMNETATRGSFVSLSTAGSGAAMDSSVSVASVVAEASGAYALGCLLNDVVNLDLTRQHINYYKNEVQQGGKVTILRKGVVVTDQVSGSPTAGATAYLADSGKVSSTQDGTAPSVGQFLSTKDADGYAKVSINI